PRLPRGWQPDPVAISLFAVGLSDDESRQRAITLPACAPPPCLCFPPATVSMAARSVAVLHRKPRLGRSRCRLLTNCVAFCWHERKSTARLVSSTPDPQRRA